MAWSKDGRYLYLARPKFLTRIDIANGEETKIAEQSLRNLTGDRQGKQFAFSTSVVDWNIWRLDGSTGQRYEKWIAASGEDSEPSYSPDGQRITFRSTRSGVLELWVCAAEGSNPRQLTHMKGRVESARWSPDGRQIAFWAVSQTDQLARVYVIPSDGGEPKVLTPNTFGSYYPIWTANGKSILFTGGETQAIWSVPADGSGHPVWFAPGKWLDAFVSSDGEWIYFTKDYETPGLWRMPARGAGDNHEPERVEGTAGLVTYRYWDQAHDIVYFVDQGMSKTVRAFDLKNRRTRVVYSLDGELFLGPRGLAVSPDGKSILITKLDAHIGDVKMIDTLP